MELIVEPADGPVDVAPRISLSGAPDGTPMNLTIDVVDAAGYPWQSVTTVESGSAPTLPWSQMQFVDTEVPATAFTAPADQLTYQLTATTGHRTMTAGAVRRWRADQVIVTTTPADQYQLTTFTPPGPDAHSVLMIPGSTGVQAVTPMAALLASKGFRVGVLAYMGAPGLPQGLCRVPLEALAAGYREFAAGRASAIMGMSVGTGGMFAMLAAIQDIQPVAVIGIAPTSVSWQALPSGGPPPSAPMWTLAGQDLPWLSSHGERAIGQILRHATIDRLRRHPTTRALKLLAGYAKGLQELPSHPEAAIHVENINAPLLLLSGEADAMWPSSDMAADIITRRQRDDDRHITFAEAGHFLRPPITPTTVPHNDNLWSGGTPSGNAQAQADGWHIIIESLNKGLCPDGSKPGA